MTIIDLLLFPHFIVMLIAAICISIGLITVVIHKPEQWFLLHKVFIGIGLLVIFVGLIVLAVLRLGLLHAIFGLITLILLLLSAIGGFIATKKKDQKVRKGHIWMGRAIYLLMLLTIIFGILTFLVFL